MSDHAYQTDQVTMPSQAHKIQVLHPPAEKESMRLLVNKSVSLGELVVVAFDQASQVSSNPGVASRLAAQTVAHILEHALRRNSAPITLLNARPHGRLAAPKTPDGAPMPRYEP